LPDVASLGDLAYAVILAAGGNLLLNPAAMRGSRRAGSKRMNDEDAEIAERTKWRDGSSRPVE
jgi:hypothetical protein